MKTKRDLLRVITKFKNNFKYNILIRYTHDDIEEIQQLITYFQDNKVSLDDENMEILSNIFEEFIADIEDEEIHKLIDDNIEEVTYKLEKFMLEILSEILFTKQNNENIEKKIVDEVLKIRKIKEREYITQEELEEIFRLKKDKILELRVKKELKYFQMGDKEKVLFKLEDVRKFMNKYTK